MHPNYRLKGNGSLISQVVEHLKLNIRSRYRSKVPNYIHDIIIHVADNFSQTKKIQEIIDNSNKYKIQEFINLKYLLKRHYNNDMFNRTDMLVRKHSIQQYLNNVDYNFDFYKKMQSTRGFKKTDILLEKFKNLIKSLNDNGFNNNYPINCSFNYRLLDGSHRLAYLYLKKEKFVCVKTRQCKEYIENNINYSKNWFINKSFTKGQLNLIDKELSELKIFLSDI
jgi:hypothetical protein